MTDSSSPPPPDDEPTGTFEPLRPGDLDDHALIPRRLDFMAMELRELRMTIERLMPNLAQLIDRVREVEQHQTTFEQSVHRRLDELAAGLDDRVEVLETKTTSLEQRLASISGRRPRRRSPAKRAVDRLSGRK